VARRIRPQTAAREQDGFWGIFERSVNPMLLADDQRRYQAANDAACRLFGLSRPELLTMTIDDVTPPEARDGIDEVWATFLAQGSLTGRYELLLPGDRREEVEYSATAEVLPGRHLSIFLTGAAPPRPPESESPETAAEGSTNRERPSPRELEILAFVALGSTSAQIADALALSPETVRTHIRNAMQKLGARTRAQAIAIVMRRGDLRQ
jgi:PAS domain S-box-containing protein